MSDQKFCNCSYIYRMKYIIQSCLSVLLSVCTLKNCSKAFYRSALWRIKESLSSNEQKARNKRNKVCWRCIQLQISNNTSSELNLYFCEERSFSFLFIRPIHTFFICVIPKKKLCPHVLKLYGLAGKTMISLQLKKTTRYGFFKDLRYAPAW